MLTHSPRVQSTMAEKSRGQVLEAGNCFSSTIRRQRVMDACCDSVPFLHIHSPGS